MNNNGIDMQEDEIDLLELLHHSLELPHLSWHLWCLHASEGIKQRVRHFP